MKKGQKTYLKHIKLLRTFKGINNTHTHTHNNHLKFGDEESEGQKQKMWTEFPSWCSG